MSTQFGDFLAAHAARIADLWARQVQSEGGAVAQRADSSRGPRQFINAVLVALTADDLRPLRAFYSLDATDAGLSERLDAAVRHLQALRGACAEAAHEEGVGHDTALQLALATSEETGLVARRLAVGCTQMLQQELQRATSTSSARGTSLSVTMHELRRPLTILNSYGQLLSTGMLGTLPETALVAIEGITASTEMMMRMVNALAELSRLEDPDDRLTMETMTAEELVNGAVEQVATEAKLRDTTVSTEVPKNIRLNGDRRRLTLALTNLLGNAIKHGPAASTIEVTVRAQDGMVHFAVRDHGEGFPPEDAEHLFDKYFRSVAERHRKVPGSGLGLYIVRTVAERHNGSVVARSKPGQGAEFEIILPMQTRAHAKQ
jgi:signal transduction histidine kinase